MSPGKLLVTAFTVCALLSPGAARADEGGPDDGSARPWGFSLGIGAGWDLPSPIDELNTASVRFRLANGLTLEPRVELSRTTDRSELGMTDLENKFTALTLQTTARWPMLSRGPVDLLVIGGVGLDYDKTNPEGDDNNTTRTALSLLWGVGVEYWFGPRWALSLTALNPLFTHTNEKRQMVGDDLENSVTSFGAVFDPDIIAMLHLFY